MLSGKAKKMSWQTTAVTRHMHEELCPVAHLGWWIFYRHAILKDNFIDIIVAAQSTKEWHGIPVLAGIVQSSMCSLLLYLIRLIRHSYTIYLVLVVGVCKN